MPSLPKLLCPLLAALAGCATTAPDRAIPGATPQPLARRAEAALPGVVLLVTMNDQGTRGYGAGILVGPEGLVLTNLHVVKGATSIGVLLYSGERTSYTPMDGGLSRYLFEHEDELVSAALVRSHDALDVALLQVAADTSALPRLPIDGGPARIGDTVFALGHPQESLWSFSSGVVSAIHQGAIQHDAPLNPGSSGGPLLSLDGKVVGINTLKVLGGADGLGFARPVALVRAFVEEAAGEGIVNLATLRSAVTSCFRAQELAVGEAIECVDWDAHMRLFDRAIDGAAARLGLGGESHARLAAAFRAAGHREAWLAWFRARTLAWFRGERPRREPPQVRTPGLDQRRIEEVFCARRPAVRSLADAAMRRMREEIGFKGDPGDSRSMKAALRMGLRIEAIQWVEPDREAWVKLAGRNEDGTRYRFSERWSLKGTTWHQHWPPSPEDLAVLPKGWPPPWDDYAVRVAELELAVLSLLHPAPAPDLCGSLSGRPRDAGPQPVAPRDDVHHGLGGVLGPA